MRGALCKPLSGTRLLTLGVLVAVMLAGCAQNGDGNGQPSDEQTAPTEPGMTAQETTAGEETTVQRTQDSGQEEATQDQAKQRESGREEQQGEQQTITVRITGTEGLSFAGRVGTAQDRRRVQGSVPEEYEVPFEGAAVTAAFRKREPGGGTLGVEVVRDGRVVASQEASTSTGVVNVIWTPQQQQGN